MSYSVAPSTQAAITSIICKADDGISRAEIAQKTGLSSSTISNVVRILLDDGIVDESPAASTGGRRTQLLRPTQRHAPVWVAEIGSSHTRIGVLDRPGNLVSSTDIPMELSETPEETLGLIVDALRQLSIDTLNKENPAALGLALPGPVDQRTNRVIGAARMTGWNNVDLTPLFTTIVSCPVMLDNDARAGAIGECSLRETEPQTFNGIYIKAGTGIGAAAVINGNIYTGGHGLAGDIAHNAIAQAQGRPCRCGRFGCVETLASGEGLITALAEQGIVVASIAELIEKAQQWDPHVTTMVRDAGTYVGQVLAPLVTFLNPSHLIVGGALSSIDVFTAGIRSQLYDLCLPMTTTDLIIETSLGKADAALYGMATSCFSAIERI